MKDEAASKILKSCFRTHFDYWLCWANIIFTRSNLIPMVQITVTGRLNLEYVNIAELGLVPKLLLNLVCSNPTLFTFDHANYQFQLTAETSIHRGIHHSMIHRPSSLYTFEYILIMCNK